MGVLPGIGGAIGGSILADKPITSSFLSRVSSTTNGTSYSFTGYSLGSASSDRSIAVIVYNQNSSSGSPTSSSHIPTGVTIAGIVATLVASDTLLSGGSIDGVSIWVAAVPAGATGTIAVSYGFSQQHCIVDGFIITGATVVAADGVARSNYDLGSSATIGTASLSVVAGSVQLAGASNADTDSFTWSGLTERTDSVIESHGYSGASLNSAVAASISPSITVSGSGGSTKRIIAVSLKGS